MLKKNKNILILLSIAVVLIISMFFVFNKKEEYKELPKVKLKDSINTSGLAIMVESDYKTEQYTKWENKEFPTDGYTLNRIKSGCVDKNGNNIDALTYNEGNKTISIKTKQSVYCYLYYDNLFKGNGTEDEPYEINYIEDLVRLSNSVNNDNNNYNSKYFILKRNLDFNENGNYLKYNDTGFGDINGISGVEGIKDELTNPKGSGFIPIGNNNTYFQGNFNGNNNRLDNIYIYNKEKSKMGFGLFGYASNSNIIDFTISGKMHTDFATTIGGIIGMPRGNIIIDNCINEINITSNAANNSVAGLVGDILGTLTMNKSTNKGNISGSNNAGGLVGFVDANSTLTINDSVNYGIIENDLGNHLGGLVGRDNATTSTINITNSHNYGLIKLNKDAKVTTDTSVGGLVGWSNGTMTIENSTNEIVIKDNEIGINVNSQGTGIIASGGLVGTKYNKIVNIKNSYNLSNIKVEGNTSNSGEGISVGGIIGRLGAIDTKGILTNNYNTGKIEVNSNVKAVNRIGGIIGWQSNGELTIENNHNEGIINVNGIHDLNVGGLIGISQNTSTISNSYNIGEIKSLTSGNNANNVGGILGNITSSDFKMFKITNCYNKGSVTGGTRIGGILGVSCSQIKLIINKCYNTGNITGQEDTIYTSGVESGGILGQVWNGPIVYILNSYNIGEIKANANNTFGNAGGISYGADNNVNVSNLFIINSYNKGKVVSKTNASGISSVNDSSNLFLNNNYNIGETNSQGRYEISWIGKDGKIKSLDNIYYKEGLVASNKSLTGLYPITDANMKNPDGNDSNSLLYKLNQNVNNLNNTGLASIDDTIGTDLDGYTLVNWKIDSTTGYPTLDYNLETE